MEIEFNSNNGAPLILSKKNSTMSSSFIRTKQAFRETENYHDVETLDRIDLTNNWNHADVKVKSNERIPLSVDRKKRKLMESVNQLSNIVDIETQLQKEIKGYYSDLNNGIREEVKISVNGGGDLERIEGEKEVKYYKNRDFLSYYKLDPSLFGNFDEQMKKNITEEVALISENEAKGYKRTKLILSNEEHQFYLRKQLASKMAQQSHQIRMSSRKIEESIKYFADYEKHLKKCVVNDSLYQNLMSHIKSRDSSLHLKSSKSNPRIQVGNNNFASESMPKLSMIKSKKNYMKNRFSPERKKPDLAEKESNIKESNKSNKKSKRKELVWFQNMKDPKVVQADTVNQSTEIKNELSGSGINLKLNISESKVNEFFFTQPETKHGIMSPIKLVSRESGKSQSSIPQLPDNQIRHLKTKSSAPSESHITQRYSKRSSFHKIQPLITQKNPSLKEITQSDLENNVGQNLNKMPSINRTNHSIEMSREKVKNEKVNEKINSIIMSAAEFAMDMKKENKHIAAGIKNLNDDNEDSYEAQRRDISDQLKDIVYIKSDDQVHMILNQYQVSKMLKMISKNRQKVKVKSKTQGQPNAYMNNI